MDRQSERVILVLEDMIRACIIDFNGNWDEKLHVVEFAYNNSFSKALVWLYLKHCMEEHVELLFVEMK